MVEIRHGAELYDRKKKGVLVRYQVDDVFRQVEIVGQVVQSDFRIANAFDELSLPVYVVVILIDMGLDPLVNRLRR